LNFEKAARDIKFLGYVSTALFLLGILILIGLIIEIGLTASSNMGSQDFFNIFIIFSLEGFAGICIVLGILFFVLKRNCNDHYQLEKSRRELMEILESK